MLSFKRLIEENEEWLIDLIVEYARDRAYTEYSSTLREAWRISVCGISKPLVAFIEAAQGSDRPQHVATEKMQAFGVVRGLQHRAMGISVSDFFGMLKLYRRAYVDLIEEKEPQPDQRHALRALIIEMFDAMEIGILRAWESSTETEKLSELQHRNRELSNEKNKYLTVFESIAEPAILLDTDNCPTHVNAAANRLLPGESQPGAGYYGHRDSPALQAIVARILQSRGAADETLTLETTSGTLVFHVALQEMLDISKKFAGTVIILQDVTEFLKAIEAARAADRAKSVFLTTLSHEIRTPINNILGLTGLLDDGGCPADKARHLRSMRASGEVLSTLIENALGFSKAESNALQLIEQDFNLTELCDSLFRVLDLEEFRKQLALRKTIAPDVPTQLHGDSHKLRHILMNLLSNAVKFTASGTVRLRVTHQARREDGRHVLCFEVIDTGPGLQSDEVAHLFEPYFQGPRSAEMTQTHGSGLGLAISHHLVQFLGGEIDYRPNPSGGAIFRFRLSFAEARRPQAPEFVSCGGTVLVVEDDPVNAIVFEGYLHDLGYRVRLASTYSAAITALEETAFDIVVTDYKLDGRTGLDVAKAVAQLRDPVPVIVVTAAIPENAQALTAQSQARQFLEKPFSRHELAHALSSVSRTLATTPVAPEDTEGAVDAVDRHVTPADLDRLLSDLGPERCRAVVESYKSNARDLVAGMQEQLRHGAVSEVSDLAHQLISASGFVGAWKTVALSREITALCKSGEIAALDETLGRLERERTDAQHALDSYWQNIETH